MDAYGHINNVQFLRLIEEARVLALSNGDGSGVHAGNETGADLPETGLLVARSEIEYFAPLTFRAAPIAVDIWVSRIGAADFDMAYEVLNPDPSGPESGQVYARAQSLLVAFDLAAGRPRRIAAEERERLESWRDEPIRWRRRRGSAE